MAQTPTDRRPDFGDASSVRSWLKENNVPAIAIGVIHDSALQEVRTYGELDGTRPVKWKLSLPATSACVKLPTFT